MPTIHTLTRRLSRCLSAKLDELQHRVRLIAGSFRDTLADIVGTSLADTLGQVLHEVFDAISTPQSQRHDYRQHAASDYWGEPLSDWDQFDDKPICKTEPQQQTRSSSWRLALLAAGQLLAWLWHRVRSNRNWVPVWAGSALGAVAVASVPAAMLTTPLIRFADYFRHRWRSAICEPVYQR